jgi:RNA polymerase sigma factor (sigma-70 family)
LAVQVVHLTSSDRGPDVIKDWELVDGTGQIADMDLSMRTRLRAGESMAFGELFDTYARPVYFHGYRLTGDRSIAEDVLSATFLEAWRLRARIEPDGGSLRPWLLGIATNVVRNMTRKARRERGLLARLTPRESIPDFADDLVGRIDDASTLTAVQAGMRALRTEEREVIALCVWGGLEYAEAAEALGIPVGTVRSRLSRARRRLMKLRTPIEDAEPAAGWRQLEGGSASAARPAQEGNR